MPTGLDFYLPLLAFRARLAAPDRIDRGEGVISTAIAVLLMAALGALMWVGFQEIWGDTKDKTQQQIDNIDAP